jgi:hypothetical protein
VRLLSALLLFAAAGYSQTGGSSYRAPRTVDGQPDLQGIWQARGTASYNLEDHGPSLGVLAGGSYVVDPPNGRIPYQPSALKTREANAKNRSTADPLGKCFLPGVPRVMYIPFPFQIFQTADFVIIASEFAHTLRTIHFKGEHPEELEFWMGDSRGRWEGDSLVVDVADFNGETWFDQAGNFHSEAMHVVERFTRTAPDVLTYEAAIEDPKTFTRPWKIRVPLELEKQRKQLLEYECHIYLEDEQSAAKEKK